MSMCLEVINQQEVLGKDFKIYGTPEEPLFLAKDVANWIEHSSITMMLKKIDEDEKVKVRPKQSLGLLTNNNEYWFLTEDGFYEVLMQSRKPIAKAFKKAVKKILKDIRTTGGYIVGQENLSDDELLERAVMVAQRKIKERDKEIAYQRKQIAEMQPKAVFADAVSSSSNSILVRDMAKLLKQNGVDIGEKRLFEYLRNNGYLIKRPGADYNSPTQKSMELGLFEIKETVVAHTNDTRIHKTSKITGKGQRYFVNKFLNKDM